MIEDFVAVMWRHGLDPDAVRIVFDIGSRDGEQASSVICFRRRMCMRGMQSGDIGKMQSEHILPFEHNPHREGGEQLYRPVQILPD